MATIGKDIPANAPVRKAIEQESADRALAQSLADAAKLEELRALCDRLIGERKIVAEAFLNLIATWRAIERVATEAIAFAREVINSRK